MRFFDVIRSSFFDPAFYAGMKDRPIQEGAKYYFAVALIIIFIYLVPLWGALLLLDSALVDKITAAYPDNLDITFGGGELHTNQPEPYAVPNPFFDKKPANIAVFDTHNDDYSPESFAQLDTMILFKKTFAAAQDSGDSGARVFSYGTTTLATTTLTKAKVLAGAQKIKPYVRPAAVIGGAFVFVLAEIIGGIAVLAFHLLYLFVPACIVYAAWRINRTMEPFHAAYVSVLFASIPVAIFSAAAALFGGLPFLIYTLLVLLIVGLNRSTVRSETIS